MQNRKGESLLLSGLFAGIGILCACGGPPNVQTVEAGADAACQVFLLLDPSAPDIAKEGCLTVEQLAQLKLKAVKVPKAACAPAASSR